MKHLAALLSLSTLICTAPAYATPNDPVSNFVRDGGRIETVNGTPIDFDRDDVSQVNTFVVRPGGRDHYALVEQGRDAIRVTLMSARGQVLMSGSVPAELLASPRIQLAAANEAKPRTLGDDLTPLIKAGTVMFGLLCLTNVPTCPLFAAIMIAHLAVHQYERHHQLAPRPDPAVTPTPTNPQLSVPVP